MMRVSLPRRTMAMLVIAGLPAAAGSPAAIGGQEDLGGEAYELDRPGEVENPFALPAGRAQLVNYLLAANPDGRESQELGSGGSAVLLQTDLRLGLGSAWEGQVFTSTYLNAVDKGPDGENPGVSRAGLGYVTLRAKWNFLASLDGDTGLGLAPFVGFPLRQALAGRAGAEPGLILPFETELGDGWEIQGSSGLIYGHGDDGGHVTTWEIQTSIERQFSRRCSGYLEPEVEVGEGAPAWSVEGGITVALTRRLQLDCGYNRGLGRNSQARFGYLGCGAAF